MVPREGVTAVTVGVFESLNVTAFETVTISFDLPLTRMKASQLTELIGEDVFKYLYPIISSSAILQSA